MKKIMNLYIERFFKYDKLQFVTMYIKNVINNVKKIERIY